MHRSSAGTDPNGLASDLVSTELINLQQTLASTTASQNLYFYTTSIVSDSTQMAITNWWNSAEY